LFKKHHFARDLAWITGGARGIGAAVSRELQVANLEILELDSGVFDLGDRGQRTSWLTSQIRIPGVLILNAGINRPANFEEQSEEDFLRILEVNLISNREILLKVLPTMANNGFGRIVFMSSLYSNKVRQGRSSYSISKAGVDALMRSVAMEYAHSGILANAVAPGFINTDLTYRNNSESEIKKIIERIPMKRFAESSEVAKVVAFLASESNSYITGQTLHVDGGMSLT
jgi:3-oxoacyl-[acyl-carrier protein] reductase